MPSFDVAIRAMQGSRSHQEDCALVWPGGELVASGELAAAQKAGEVIAVLADGMGGHIGGALASHMACEAFVAKAQESGADTACSPTHNGDRLRRALAAANDAIAGKVAARPMFSGMGTTLIGAICHADGLEWVSVGDSLLLHHRSGSVVRLNADHSLAPQIERELAAGRITQAQARRDPRRHMLCSAVTGDEIDLVDVSTRPAALDPGDTVILASDGLHTLETRQIARLVTENANQGGSGAIARALIQAIEMARDPQQDNATVIIVRRR